MQSRFKFFDMVLVQSQCTPEEKELEGYFSQLIVINDGLKDFFGLDLDALYATEAKSIIALDESKETCDLLIKTKERAELLFNNIKDLLEKKPSNIDINKQDMEVQVSLLHSAAGMGSFKLINLFFQYGADPNLQNCFGQTPSQRARFWAGRPDIANYLDTLHAAYNRSISLARTGMFRHAYREDFSIESDYQPNQEPLKLR